MKGKIKKTLLGVAALAFAFAGVGSLATYQAKASEPALFEMVQGASVRTSEDTSGIRFSFKVNSDQQTALNGYKAVEYGMLITQKSEATIDEIYNAGAAVFAENGDWSFDKADIETKKFLVNITGNTLVDEKDEQGTPTGNKLFNAALTNISQANFTATYVGVGYIKTTRQGETDSADDDVVEYHFASNNSNERTITYVAEKAIADNDANAVGNEVVANYVSGGYANLELTVENTKVEAGTETNPYLVTTDAVHAKLKNAATNSLIYGAGKYMALKPEVDCTNLLAETDRNYTYMWTNDNYGPTDIAEDTDGVYELENFNSPSTKAAAYNGTLNEDGVATADKSIMNPTANWEEAVTDESGETRYGVISMNSIDTPTTSNYGATYLLKSTYRNKNYVASVRSPFQNLYDYVSMWIYIEKPEDSVLETVDVQSQDLNFTKVPLGKWVEYKVHLPLFGAKNYGPYTLFSNNLTSAANDKKSVLMIHGDVDYKVYVDSIAYVKNDEVMDLNLEITDTTNNYATMTVSLKEGVSLNPTDVLYYARGFEGTSQVSGAVKTSGTNAMPANGKTVSWDGESVECTFALNTSKEFDALWIYARFEIEGKVYVSHCIYDYADGVLTLRTA